MSTITLSVAPYGIRQEWQQGHFKMIDILCQWKIFVLFMVS